MTRLFDAVATVAAILVIWLGLYAYAGDVAITPPLRTFAFAAELFARASFWNHVGATSTRRMISSFSDAGSLMFALPHPRSCFF
jgi:ABC-type nitrate/sulfonate/bicarbonate transport system permease component